MQMCPNCDRVYDESEYSKCPYCHKNSTNNSAKDKKDSKKKSK